MRPRIPSRFPISKLVFEAFQQSNLGLKQFVLKLGYKNANNGVAKFDQWIKEGTGTSFFLQQLVQVFSVSAADIRQALEETKAIAEKEEQEAERLAEEARERNFVPWIFIETHNNRPDSITMFVLTGGSSKIINLSKAFLGMEKERSLRIVSWLVKRHYKKTRGYATAYGPISGYRFVRTYEENILFDTEGRQLEVVQSRFKLPYSFGWSFRGTREQTIALLKADDWSCIARTSGRDAEKEIDELYRDKYDLKELGDAQVKAKRTKDGSLELADRVAVKKQAETQQRSNQRPEKSGGRER